MTVVLRFTAGSSANGLMASAFQRSSQGVGLFFTFKQQVTVANDRATFNSITAPGEFAFTVESPAGTRFRSGRQIVNTSPTDTFAIISVGALTFSPAQLSAMLPALPFTSGPATITTLTATPGTGSITAAGTGTIATAFGPIPVSFSYVFTIFPETEPANMGLPGFIAPSLKVATVSMTVTAMAGGPLGFLVNFFAGILIGIMSGSIRATLQGRVQAAVDTAVANALASASAPAGTIATVESVTIAPTGLSIVAFAGFSLEKACASTPSGGSIQLRSRTQLVHLRAIRDRLLTRSPRGAAYIETFEHFSEEVASMLTRDEELLKGADTVVALALRELPIDNPGKGRVSRRLASAVVKLMTMMEEKASPELKLTLGALKGEVRDFVDRPAREVLDASFQLLEKPPRPPKSSAKPAQKRRK
jgi:hypothetical protein